MAILSADHAPQQLHIFRSGGETPILTQNAFADKRPHIHPLIAPDGHGSLTEDAPPHHPWQHGLYIGLNDVNGIGFWTEGLAEKRRHLDGTFHPQPLPPPQCADNAAQWTVRTQYRTPDSASLMAERQEWKLKDLDTHYEMALTWTLTAETDLCFGQYPYGGLFIRMPYKKGIGAAFLNSEGHRNPTEAEARKARWAAIAMPIEGRTGPAGVAILDHPQNPEHPTPWRVDGQYGICPSRCIAGPWTLQKGQTQTFKYALYIFPGPIDARAIETCWSLFSQP